jgi:hypothetical protein
VILRIARHKIVLQRVDISSRKASCCAKHRPGGAPVRQLAAAARRGERLSVRLLTVEPRVAGPGAAVASGDARVTGIEVSIQRANGERYVRVVAL